MRANAGPTAESACASASDSTASPSGTPALSSVASSRTTRRLSCAVAAPRARRRACAGPAAASTMGTSPCCCSNCKASASLPALMLPFTTWPALPAALY